MQSNLGVYALLLGSGVSRSAGIPTGWEVTMDLTRKIAELHGEDPNPDPERWYTEKYGIKPDYSRLLLEVGGSPAERQALLRGYFEPDADERENGAKLPTDAHRAVAELVERNYVRAIITTNFDRLLETAIAELTGSFPYVVSSPEAAEGAAPLQHTGCTIVKVNGDYLDERIKNTVEELTEDYDQRISDLLSRIFDEYGLIVCGWSGDYDDALRREILRSPSRRYTTYWTALTQPRGKAEDLIRHRDAKVIHIQGADSFFRDLADKVQALEDYGGHHPLSKPIAIAMAKRYLAEERYIVRLHDLVMEEANRLHSELTEDLFPLNIPYDDQHATQRIARYEELAEIPTALMAHGCYWGNRRHDSIWAKCLERVANPPRQSSGMSVWSYLGLYPALQLLYAGGVAAVVADDYETLKVLLTNVRVEFLLEAWPAAVALHTWWVRQNRRMLQDLPGLERTYNPLSDHLFSVLREPLAEIVPQAGRYQTVFDRFEYLVGLVHVDLKQLSGSPYVAAEAGWGPVGRFGWRNHYGPQKRIMAEVEEEIERLGADWPPLRAGMFEGSLARLQEVKRVFDEFVVELDWR
jgi:hypothetical protein